MNITIIDYGMGNLKSVTNAFEFLNARPIITNKPKDVINADAIVLPGVGSFPKAMNELQTLGLIDAIHEAVTIKRRKILGICLGFQMLGLSGTENSLMKGIGLIPCEVDRFCEDELKGLKLPHIGFNYVKFPKFSKLFYGMDEGADFYFVHSFRIKSNKLPGQVAESYYGSNFVAAYEHENIFGSQFHPEKSQTNGLQMLLNFMIA